MVGQQLMIQSILSKLINSISQSVCSSRYSHHNPVSLLLSRASLKVWPTANRISVTGTYQPAVVKLYGEPTK